MNANGRRPPGISRPGSGRRRIPARVITWSPAETGRSIWRGDGMIGGPGEYLLAEISRQINGDILTQKRLSR